MRLLLCSLVLVLTANFSHAQSPTASDEKQLMAMEEAYEKAVDKHDAAGISMMDKHLVDPIITIDTYGTFRNRSRQEIMSELRGHSDPGITFAYKQSNYKVNVNGATAVVTYQAVYSLSGMKNEALNVKDLPGACMDVFIKQKNEWYGWATTCTPTKSVPQATYDAQTK
jgi:hypothetical protein